MAKEKRGSLLASAGVVSGATAFSRVLGLIREQVMAYFFGASMATDAFVTAFRMPNLLRDLFAEGALSSAFVPVFKQKLVAEGADPAFALGRIVITNVLVVVGLIVLLGIVAAPAIIYISAYGFVEEAAKFDLTVSLTRLMFVYLLLVSLSAVVMGMLNSFGRFGIPALSPAMFNLGIVVCVVVLHDQLRLPIYSMAIGVLVGGLAQLAVQLPLLLRLGFTFRPVLSFLDESFKRVLRLLAPMVIGLSAGRVNILVSTLIASLLGEGAISYLSYAFRLMHFPLGVFAVALGTVALPKASEVATGGDMQKMRDTFVEAINLNFLVIMPSAAVLAVWGRDIVELVFQYGAFSAMDADNTARALLHYSYGLIGLAAVRVTVPFYYSLGDARLPTRISVSAVVLNLLLYWPLVKILGFAGLAAATSLASVLNFGALLWFMPDKGIPVSRRAIVLRALRIALAALLAVLISKLWPLMPGQDLPEIWRRIVTIVIGFSVAGIVYLLLCMLFKIRELNLLTSRIVNRFKRE
jgi:putative peptidoglycan lipid II flippase